MLKNYIKIACRNLSKHKFYSLINIFGLSLGITWRKLWYDNYSGITFLSNDDGIIKLSCYRFFLGGPDYQLPQGDLCRS